MTNASLCMASGTSGDSIVTTVEIGEFRRTRFSAHTRPRLFGVGVRVAGVGIGRVGNTKNGEAITKIKTSSLVETDSI